MNEQSLLRIAKENKKIFIYGAGMVGGLVFNRLKVLGVDESKLDFVVTKAMENQYYYNHKVYNISDCDFGEEYLIIVSTLTKNRGQILEVLKHNNLNDYVIVDEELFDNMERAYISDFMYSRKSDIVGDRDILFMSSDNNNTSGAFLCMVELCREMMECGKNPLVVLPGYGNAEQLLRDNHIEYTFVQSRSGLSEIDKEEMESAINQEAVRKIEKLIFKHNVKLVHINTNHTYVGAVAAQNMGIPYICHIRENIREQGFRFINEDYRYALINSAAKIITVSNYIGKCYPRLNKDKVVCIYDGVDASKYYSEHEIMCEDTVRILMPGVMIPLKGQHQLIEATKELKKTGIKFDISFIGSGDAEYVRMLEECVDKYGLNDMIHFYERVNDLERWYQNTDLVIVCSRSEAFGRVTVEAQMAGCIVIGADCGATPELISDGDTGFLYELDNIEMLKNKILYVCNERKKAVMIAKNGQKNALKLYDKSLNCGNVLNEYKKVLGE